MSQYPNSFDATGPRPMYGPAAAVVSFFNLVYAWMAAGLALTAVVAYFVSTQRDVMAWVFNPGVWIVLLVVELGLIISVSAAVNRLGPSAATLLFLLYAAINGLTLSAIFIAYTGTTIAGTFAATAGTFAVTSIYGMLTKRDLTRLGSLLFMGLVGLVIASVVNLFWANTTLYWLVTYAGVLIFVGLAAYDTQRLKEIAHATAGDSQMAARLAVNGALALYLDFINLFLMLLRVADNRRQ
jgi:FtsH-binding integral membrane protein